MDTNDTVVERGQCGHLQFRKTHTASQSQTALDSLLPYHTEHARSHQTALDRSHPRAQDTQQPKVGLLAGPWPSCE